MANRLILVDGSSYLFRAYHALPCLWCEGDRCRSGVAQDDPANAIEVLAQREMDLPGLIQLLLTDRVAILTTLYDQQPPLCW